jgi:WD40 repeat protein
MTAERWYIGRANKQRYGPYTFGELNGLARAGELLPTDMLLPEGASKWVPASSVPELFPAQSATRPFTLKIFVSSPGDVAEERFLTEKVIQRLRTAYQHACALEPIFWEHEPLVATDTFQAQLTSPQETDIVICILWSRLGTRLPREVTGGAYQTGTEYEFSQAVEGKRRRGIPDLLVYRKQVEPFVSLVDTQRTLEAVAQKRALDEFIQKWFHGEDGTLIAAFHAFQDAATFEEHLELHLRKLIERRLNQAGVHPDEAPRRPPTWTSGSPFRGLNAFDFEHEAIFFGRTRAISEVVDRLKRQAETGRVFLLMLGMSGCGKSSLLRAGVLPWLSRPGVIEGVGLCRRAIFRPSDPSGDVFDGMATALLLSHALPELAADGTTPVQLASMLRDQPAAVPLLIKGALSQAAAALRPAREGLRQPEARLLFVVDQLEELFTHDRITQADRLRFAEALAALARSNRTWVLATLRSDFYSHFAQLGPLADLKEDLGQYDLKPPRPAEISQMIRQPAAAAGLRFEESPETGEKLDDALRDAAAGDPSNLPLLEFTLDELYRGRTEQGVLTLAAYAELGGVEGALARRAESVFASLPPFVQAVLPAVFRQLVTVNSPAEDLPTRKEANLTVFQVSPAQARLVEAFVAARLLVTDQANDRSPVVRITHESLLLKWERLQSWLATDRELLRIRTRVMTAAARWDQEGRPSDLLLPAGKPLEEATQLDRSGLILEPVVRDLLVASRQRARRMSRLRRAAVAGLAVLTLVTAVLAVAAETQRQAAETQRQQAETANAGLESTNLQLESAITNLNSANTDLNKALKDKGREYDRAERELARATALRLLAEARQVSDEFPCKGTLLAAEAIESLTRKGQPVLAEAQNALLELLGQISGEGVPFSSSEVHGLPGSGLEIAEGWYASLPPRTAGAGVTPHDFGNSFAQFPLAQNQSIDIRTTPRHRLVVVRLGRAVSRFTPDAARQVGRTVMVGARGSELRTLLFSPSGEWFISSSEDGTVRCLDVDQTVEEPPQRTLAGHSRPPEQFLFFGSGRYLLTAESSGKLLRWDLKSNPGTSHVQLSAPAVGKPEGRAKEDQDDIAFFAIPDGVTATSNEFSGRWQFYHGKGEELRGFDRATGRWYRWPDVTAGGPQPEPVDIRSDKIGNVRGKDTVTYLSWVRGGRRTIAIDDRYRVHVFAEGDLEIPRESVDWSEHLSPRSGKEKAGGGGRRGPTLSFGSGDVSLALSRSGRYCYCGCADGTIFQIDLEKPLPPAPSARLGLRLGGLGRLALSPDETRLLMPVGNRRLLALDLNHETFGKPDAPVRGFYLSSHESGPIQLGFSADGQWLFTVGTDRVVRRYPLLDLMPGSAAMVFGREQPRGSAVLSPDGRSLAAFAVRKESTRVAAQVWDLDSVDAATTFRTLQGEDKPGLAGFAVDIDEGRSVTWWPTGTHWRDRRPGKWREPGIQIPEAERPWKPVGVTADGAWSLTQGANGAFRLWDLRSDKPRLFGARLTAEAAGEISKFDVSANGEWAVVLTKLPEGKLFFFDLRSSPGGVVNGLEPRLAGADSPEREIKNVVLNRNGLCALVRNRNDRVGCCHLAGLSAPGPWRAIDEKNSTSIVRFNDDANWILAGIQEVGLVAIDARDATLQSRRLLFAHDPKRFQYDIEVAGPYVLAARTHENALTNFDLSLWDLSRKGATPRAAGADFPKVFFHRPYFFSPDHRWLVLNECNGRPAVLEWWDLHGSGGIAATRKKRKDPLPLNAREAGSRAVAFSSQPDLIAVHFDSGAVRVLALSGEAKDGEGDLVLPLPTTGRLDRLMFARSSTMLFAVRGDGLILGWHLDPKRLVSHARRRVGRDLTPEERRTHHVER